MPKENLVKYNREIPANGVAVPHVLKVVSELESQDTVRLAGSVVRLGHRGQISDMQNIALESLRSVGKPVDEYLGSKIVDINAWREGRVLGEYHEAPDLFANTQRIYRDGQEIIETVAFTSQTRRQVMMSLGEPNKKDRAA